MTKKEILEDNKSIAEFLGLKYLGKNIHGFGGDVFDCTIMSDDTRNLIGDNLYPLLMINTASMKFHKSWDWLMPVIEKIESLLRQSQTPNYYTSKGYSFWMDKIKLEIPNINKTYCEVIKFIKWYNKNK